MATLGSKVFSLRQSLLPVSGVLMILVGVSAIMVPVAPIAKDTHTALKAGALSHPETAVLSMAMVSDSKIVSIKP